MDCPGLPGLAVTCATVAFYTVSKGCKAPPDFGLRLPGLTLPVQDPYPTRGFTAVTAQLGLPYEISVVRRPTTSTEFLGKNSEDFKRKSGLIR